MTEAIKQWIADEAVKMATMPGFTGEVVHQNVQLGAISGLTKGIEIAEEFDIWKESEGYMIGGTDHEGIFFYVKRGDYSLKNIYFSQLLEQYLSHLLNKEK